MDVDNYQIFIPNEFDAASLSALQSELFCLAKTQGLGRHSLWDRHIEPTIENNKERFYSYKGGKTVKEDVSFEMDGDRRALSRFMTAPSKNIQLAKCVYAFLCIRSPARINFICPKLFVRNTGAVLGAFLRDPKTFDSRRRLAVTGQKILGIYNYTAVGGLVKSSSKERSVVFSAGDDVDHIMVTDFCTPERDIERKQDADLNLYYGYCMPDTQFSPVIMRSWDLGDRVCGLLYTKNVFLDFDSPDFTNLTIHFLTSNIYRFLHYDEENTLDVADLIYSGPRIEANLAKVEKGIKYNMIQRKFENFLLEYLQ